MSAIQHDPHGRREHLFPGRLGCDLSALDTRPETGPAIPSKVVVGDFFRWELQRASTLDLSPINQAILAVRRIAERTSLRPGAACFRNFLLSLDKSAVMLPPLTANPNQDKTTKHLLPVLVPSQPRSSASPQAQRSQSCLSATGARRNHFLSQAPSPPNLCAPSNSSCCAC